jgi:myo-inositol-1(or 4)-monophosphatase
MTPRQLAISASRKAGIILKQRLGCPGRISHKGVIDIVTEMDRKAEALIIKEIRRAFPDHGILTEESPEIKGSSTGVQKRWIIDPLDGTTNYAHGFPVFCVSIAFEKDGEVMFGVVYNPMLDEMFVAEKGKGSSLNKKRIRVSSTKGLGHSLLATGFPYDVRSSRDNNLRNFSRFALKAQAIRRAGSAALDLCYAACGRFDGFWELRLKPWDTAASALIVKEAGGRVTDFKGNAFSIHSGECLASNGLIHEDMIAVLDKG